MNKYFKVAMFYTSFIPLWITILFIDILSIIRDGSSPYTEIIEIVLILLGLLFSILIITKTITSVSHEHGVKYKIIHAEQEKGITSEFLLSYILPLFAFNFTQWDGAIMFSVYYGILMFLCVRNNNVYANLFFEIRNYKFYNCELQWTAEPDVPTTQPMIIGQKNLCANKGNTVEIICLDKPFYLMKS